MKDYQLFCKVLINLTNRYTRRKYNCICKIDSLRFVSNRDFRNTARPDSTSETIYLTPLKEMSDEELEINKELIRHFINNLLFALNYDEDIKIVNVKWIVVPQKAPTKGKG